jgi:hypothetical protein
MLEKCVRLPRNNYTKFAFLEQHIANVFFAMDTLVFGGFCGDKKVYPTNKVLFVDSHGVKRLPYRGRRTHFSSIRQILGSSTERHNDLFALAIFQFEREYKACLERRVMKLYLPVC